MKLVEWGPLLSEAAQELLSFGVVTSCMWQTCVDIMSHGEVSSDEPGGFSGDSPYGPLRIGPVLG